MVEVPVSLKPDYRPSTTHKVEELLFAQLLIMFEALNEDAGDTFDKALRFTKALLSYEEAWYTELKQYEETLRKAVYLKAIEVCVEAKDISSKIRKEKYKQRNLSNLENTFREEVLMKLIEIYFKMNLLQYKHPTYARLIPIDWEEMKRNEHKMPERGETPNGVSLSSGR